MTLVLAMILLTSSANVADGPGIILAGEPVRIDTAAQVHFTERQLRETAPGTRAGLLRWASTDRGREFLRYFTSGRYRIVVTEDASEPGEGRAPQPSILAFAAASDPNALKVYELILNPTPRQIPEGATALPGQPATSEDFLAIAWAAEMLHIYFYARGIVLPHHQRDDFQEQWLVTAAELGFPSLTHGLDEDDSPRPRVRVIGRRR